MLDKTKQAVFLKEGDGYHIIFNELLPERFKGKTASELALHRNKIFNKYYPLFEEHFSRVEEEKYRCKVNIRILHHFKSESEVKDPDNFDIKQILDYITTYLLLGDSLSHCSLQIEGTLDSDTYSEIYIYPQK